MLAIFKKKWTWVLAIFLVINIIGLHKIISLIDRKHGYRENSGIFYSINKKIRSLLWKAKEINVTIRTDDYKYLESNFIVESVQPYVSGASGYIGIRLSDEINIDEIKGYISIDPEIKFYIEKNYYGIELKGDFIPGNHYKIEVLKGLPSAIGGALKDSFKTEVVIPDYYPELKFTSDGMYMSLEGNQLIPIDVLNVDNLNITIHKVYANNIVYLLNNMSDYSVPADLGIDIFTKEIKTEAELNKKKQVLIDLREILSNDSHGLFFMRASDAKESSYQRDNKLILTTDIGILAKKSESDLLVWLNSLSTTQAVANATIKVFSKTNQQIIEGTTDLNGFAHFKDVDWAGDKKPFVITASTDFDLSFIEIPKCSISETTFDIEGRPYLSSGYEGFIYSDRGIYRPGEIAHLRAILRGKGIEVPDSFPVVFDIKKPDGMRFDKVTGILSSFGTADIDIPIPNYALTGGYNVSLKLPGDDKVIGSYSFNVEEFMPDRMKVETIVPDKRFKLEETIPVKVKAEHLFGAPASDRLVEEKYSLKPINFEIKKFSDYTFSDDTIKFSSNTIQLGLKSTDENGEANFEITLPKEIKPASSLNAIITTTVKELGGRAVTSNSTVKVDAYPYYIGIRKTKAGYVEEGEEVQINYVLISPDEKEITVEELDVRVCKIIWDTVLKKDNNGRFRYVSDEREECILEDTIKTNVSAGKFTFTPDSYGSYIVRIKGKEKTAHTASLQFYCSGYGYMPWAMERPDKIDLELDKKNYNPGDEATLLIKSPFKGKALITISKDNVILTKVLNLENETQGIPIKISEDFAPNAYCSVTVIKPVIPGEDWTTHRAYGIIPIMLNNSSHKLKVNVTSPESTLPRKEVDINIAVNNSEGLPESTELSVALVDEGVLRLTGFNIPDPFEFFFGKKRQSLETADLYSLLLPEFGKNKVGSDSNPSGDRGVDFDPKKYSNPVSAERVKPVVLWKSGIITDEQGRATVKFEIPQFTGNLKVLVVSTGQDDFGNFESEIKVAEPLMIKPTFPRFLSAEDKFEIPVSVFNTSGKEGTANISIEVSEGFEVINQKTFSVNVKDKAEGFIIFALKAPNLPRKGKIKINASMDGNFTYAEVEIPVRPAAPFMTKSGSGLIKAPSNEKLSLPNKWFKGTEQYSLSVMPLPGIKLAGGISFLAKYPYGCIEQTTSTVFPLLYLNDVAKLVESKAFSGRSVENYINAGIKRILSMQTYSGGFSFWPGYRETYAYGSVYATDFLVEADKAGYVVPKFEKDVALDYLEMILSSKEEEYTTDIKVYSIMVLSKAGRIKPSWIRRFQELEAELPITSRYNLAVALTYLGDNKGVSAMLGKTFPDKEVKRETGGFLNSYTKQNSIALSAYMDIAPESEMVPILVKRIESSMQDGSWSTTQDNAMALLALGKYARYIQSQDSEYSGSVIFGGGKNVAGFDNASPAIIKNMDLGIDDINISVQGKGNVYYYWNASGIPVDQKIEEIDSGIKVRRRFLNKQGEQINKNNISQGQVVIVEISVDSGLMYQNVVISDMLPAGFEIENPRIETRDSSYLEKDKQFVPDHIDMRDDRFLIFTDMPYANKFTYKYVVRAVTKGDYILPPISAECMYDPSIKSVSGQGRVIIK